MPPDHRVATLVLAANAPKSLLQNILVHSGSDVDFFIHVDAKADLKKFAELQDLSNVYFTETRYQVFWGGFNMVEAEILLLSTAIQRQRYHSLILISDDAFPLKTPKVLKERLINKGTMIDQYRSPELRWRYDGFFCFDSDAMNPQHRDIEKRTLLDKDIANISLMAELKVRGKASLPQLFHGSQWWCLTEESARYIVETHRNNALLKESFRFSAIPDEQYIQTLLGISELTRVSGESPMFFDFSRDPKPYVFQQMVELAAAFDSDKLYVRKISQSDELLGQLTERLLSS